jgi:hypothetical protein
MSSPVEPSPSDPVPSAPAPADPVPVDSVPVDPAPADAAPADSVPVDATPVMAPVPGPPPGSPYPQVPGYYVPGYPMYVYPKNSLAVWSLVLGILGLVMGCVFFTGIPAVIVGNQARRAAAAGEANNPGMAQAGVVLGWVSIGLGIALVAFVGLQFAAFAGVVGLSMLGSA